MMQKRNDTDGYTIIAEGKEKAKSEKEKKIRRDGMDGFVRK